MKTKIIIIVLAIAFMTMMFIPSFSNNTQMIKSTMIVNPDTETFTVSVSERGLPSGTAWYGYVVNIATGANNTIDTTSTTTSFSLGNGTYEYGFNSLKGYYPLNPNGYFTVSNGTYSLVAEYQANTSSDVYSVVFTPENIGSADWTLIINSQSYLQSGSITLNFAGGTYYYSASSDSGAKVVNTTQLDLTSNKTVDLTFYTIPNSGLQGTLNSYFLSNLGITISDFYMVIGLLSGIIIGYLIARKTGNVVLFAVPNLTISLVGDIFALMPLWMFLIELFGTFASLVIPAKLSMESGEWS